MSKYPQLDGTALSLLQNAVNGSTIAAVARKLDYSRPSISMALRGQYPGDTKKLRAIIVETFAERVQCPFLDTDIAPPECRDYRERPIPSGPRQAVNHWQACRHCVFNPNNLATKEPEHV